MRHRHAGPSRSPPEPTTGGQPSAVDHDFEIEVRHGRAGDALVVAGRDGPGPTPDERAIHRLDFLEDPVALAIETGRRRGGEDGVALELHEREIGLDALDDGVQQRPEHRVGRRRPR